MIVISELITISLLDKRASQLKTGMHLILEDRREVTTET